MSAHRAKVAKAVSKHIMKETELTEEHVSLIQDVVYALTWSRELHDFAIGRLRQIATRNKEEKPGC
jgi:hypothetical protein